MNHGRRSSLFRLRRLLLRGVVSGMSAKSSIPFGPAVQKKLFWPEGAGPVGGVITRDLSCGESPVCEP